MMQLKTKNPQQANQIQNLINNKSNPQEYLKQVIGGYSPQQMQQFIQFANNMGISTEQLNQLGINSKMS